MFGLRYLSFPGNLSSFIYRSQMSYSFSLSKLNFLLAVRKIPLRYKFQPNWCQNVSRALILKRSQFIPQSISLLFTFPSIFSYKKTNSINSSLSVIEQVDLALRAGSYDKAVSDLRELLKDDAANFEVLKNARFFLAYQYIVDSTLSNHLNYERFGYVAIFRESRIPTRQ